MTADRSAPDLTGGPSAPAPSRRADPVDEIVAAWRTELPELDLLVMQLVKRAARLTGLIDAVTVAELDRLGRTKADYEVLSRLRAAGAPYQLKPHELASELLLSSGGTTNVLHRLTAAGLLVRHADPADRRSVWVRLTPTGVTTAEEVALAVNRAQAARLDRLPAAAAGALSDQLRDVLGQLDPGGAPALRRTGP